MAVNKHCLICNSHLVAGVSYRSIYSETCFEEPPLPSHGNAETSSLRTLNDDVTEQYLELDVSRHSQTVAQAKLVPCNTFAGERTSNHAMYRGTMPAISSLLPQTSEMSVASQQASLYNHNNASTQSDNVPQSQNHSVDHRRRVSMPREEAIAPITNMAIPREPITTPNMSMAPQILADSPQPTLTSEQMLVSNMQMTMQTQPLLMTHASQMALSVHEGISHNPHLLHQKNQTLAAELGLSGHELVTSKPHMAITAEQALVSTLQAGILSQPGSVGQLVQSPRVMEHTQTSATLSEHALALAHHATAASPAPLQQAKYQQASVLEHQQRAESQAGVLHEKYAGEHQMSTIQGHNQVSLEEYNHMLVPTYTVPTCSAGLTLTAAYAATTAEPIVSHVELPHSVTESVSSAAVKDTESEPRLGLNHLPSTTSGIHQAHTVTLTNQLIARTTEHQQISVTAERQTLPVTVTGDQMYTVTAASQQPLSVMATNHHSFPITSTSQAVLSIPTASHPLSVALRQHQTLPISMQGNNEPLSVSSIEAQPAVISSTELPITSNNNQTIVAGTLQQTQFVNSSQHQTLAISSIEQSIASANLQPVMTTTSAHHHTLGLPHENSSALSAQSHQACESSSHAPQRYSTQGYSEPAQPITETFMQMNTSMDHQQLAGLSYVIPPVSTQANGSASASTIVTYVVPQMLRQVNPVPITTQTVAYDSYTTNSPYTTTPWSNNIALASEISVEEAANRFTSSPSEQTVASSDGQPQKGFQPVSDYTLPCNDVLRRVLVQQQLQSQQQQLLSGHQQSDHMPMTPPELRHQHISARLSPLISSQSKHASNLVQDFPAAAATETTKDIIMKSVKQEKFEKSLMTKLKTDDQVKLEKVKEGDAILKADAGKDLSLTGLLKDRLESALQLSLTSRMCHSQYVCQVCELKLTEVEQYYKVVTQFRQSFLKTAHVHGIEENDIAEIYRLTNSIEQTTPAKNVLADLISKQSTSSQLEGIIRSSVIDSAITIGDVSKKQTLEIEEVPKASASAEQKVVEKPQMAVLPKKRGRPRKLPLDVKKEPVKPPLPPPRLRVPRREVRLPLVEPAAKRCKVQRASPRLKQTEADDGETTEEDPPAEVDDPLDDDWKPNVAKKEETAAEVPQSKIGTCAVKEETTTSMKEEVEDDDGDEDYDDETEEDVPQDEKGIADVSAPFEAASRSPMYQCVICTKSFAGVTILKFHIQKKHRRTKITEPYKCVMCGETFESPSGVRLHIKMHVDEQCRTCEVCQRSYGSMAALNLHIRNKHPNMRKRMGKFPCGKCGKRFSCIQSLQMHTRTQHESERVVHTCGVCHRDFLDRERKENHESKCEKDTEKLNLVRDMKSERSFICKICNASYKNKSAFKQHHYTHKDEKPHQCKVCECKFLYKKSLTDHVAAVHRGERRMKAFKCEVCGHGYSHAGDLAKHMTLHSGKFCCPTCNKPCAGSYKLKEHMRIHTGEKPYRCSTCPASFTQAAGLKSHQYTHKTNKRFLCTICGMQFAHRTTFRRHGMTHTGERPYKCSICNKGFQFDWVLKDHIKTHTGEKPHLCSICGKSFTQPQHLKTHLRIHTGEKPYRCAHCDVSYRHLSSFNQHKRNCPLTSGDKKDSRGSSMSMKSASKIKILPPLVTSLQPIQISSSSATTLTTSTLPSADIIAQLTRPGAIYMSAADESIPGSVSAGTVSAVNILDQNHHMRVISAAHASLIGGPQPPQLTRVTLAETTAPAPQPLSIGSPIYQVAQTGQLEPVAAAARQLIQMGSLPQDLTHMQPSALLPVSVGLQPMDMTSSSSAIALGAATQQQQSQQQQQQQQQQQSQHEQTFSLLQTGYTQNYVH